MVSSRGFHTQTHLTWSELIRSLCRCCWHSTPPSCSLHPSALDLGSTPEPDGHRTRCIQQTSPRCC
uniref:Uncharacterized protein n=1 Tax=Anabas testudineus TaxID=64144 RepID=A0A3Q1JJC7_ANATE